MTGSRNGHFVEKKQRKIRIQTASESIEGYAHLLPDQRLSDLLNFDQQFIPVTEAVVYDKQSPRSANHVAFLAINKDHVISFSEMDASTTE